jgi:hypothetical protein
VQPANGSDFFVTLPTAFPNDQYFVHTEQTKGAVLVEIVCPDDLAGDRLPGSFRCITSAALAAGDIIDFRVRPR